MAAEGIRCERDGNTERWSIDNPTRRNAVTPSALRFIAERCAELRGEIVILEGAGGGPFCAGFDLSALADALRSDDAAPDQVLAGAAAAMQAADATFIAAARDYVIGAGVELLSACDLRIVDREAWLLVPAGRLGVVYHAEGLARVRQAFGPTAVRTLLLAGRKLRVDDPIVRSAFVELVPGEQVSSRAQTLAGELGALDPRSRAHHTRILRALDRGPLSPESAVEHESARTAAYARARESAMAGDIDDPNA